MNTPGKRERKAASPDLEARVTEIARRIQMQYGHSALKPNIFNDEIGIVAGADSEPLFGLVETILSQQSPIAMTQRMSVALRSAYPSWTLMLQAGIDGIQTVLEGAKGNLAHVKARYIHGVLARLSSERSELSLAFLRGWTATEAHEYLLSFAGVGPKTASCVLLFNLQHPAMPVDTHLQRIAGRLGFVKPAAKPLEVEIWLEAHLPKRWEAHYEFHLNAIELGQAVCRAQRPKCEVCILNDLCPSAKSFNTAND